MRKHRAGSVWMILPLYLFTLIFVALPLLYVAALSFSTADGGYGVNWKFTLDNYKQIYSALTQYVAEMNRSMVTVTGVSSGVDWFNNVNESKNQSSGVIIAQNGKQLLILTDYSPVKQVDDIIVTFNDGTLRQMHL